jgi:hypothetical protein
MLQGIIGGVVALLIVGELMFDVLGVVGAIIAWRAYRMMARELGAKKLSWVSNLYGFTLGGAEFQYGDDDSPHFRFPPYGEEKSYIFLGTSCPHAGYLGLFEREFAEHAARIHPGAKAIASGDSEFDRVFHSQSDGGEAASAFLASADHRAALLGLQELGFCEIIFNAGDHDSSRDDAKGVMARLDEGDGQLFTASMIRQACGLLLALRD